MTHDDDISAWIDRGLSAEEAKAMELKVNGDEAIALRALRFRKLDALVREAVPYEEEIPAELLERLGLDTTRPVADNVVSLAAAREARSAPDAVPPRVWWGRIAQGRVAAQWFVLLGLGLAGALYEMNSRPDEPQANYHVLGDAPADGAGTLEPNAIAMFAPGTGERRIRALLSGRGVTVIGNPNAEGVWKLNAPTARRAAILERLAADPAVTLAQPLDDGAGQ